jgi:pilus assembly protein CpaB
MSGKPMIVLAIAGICGLLAMVGVQQMLAQRQPSGPEEQQDVLVATRNIKAEEVLKSDMVEAKKYPLSQVPAGSFKSFKDLGERSVEIPILVGEPILEGKLAPKGAPPGLVARIPQGMRAFAIEVNEQTGVSGFVLPGHRVDVVQARNQPGPSSAGAPQAEVILEDVLVLASNQVFANPQDKSIIARTVTLAVTPAQVDTLVSAKTKGPLSLSLRGVNDHSPAKPKPEKRGRPLLVATKTLNPGDTLRPDDLRVAEFPEEHVPADHFSSIPEVAGRTVKRRIAVGEPILEAKLESRTAEPVAPKPVFTVRPGMRAFTFKVNVETGVDRAIQAGDRVDVIDLGSDGDGDGKTGSAAAAPLQVIIQNAPPRDGGKAPAVPDRPAIEPKRAETILQDVLVLKTTDKGPTPTTPAAANADWHVTLEVPAQEVERLARARAANALSLVLRDPDDHGFLEPPPPPAAARFGMIYHGFQKEPFPVESRSLAPAATVGRSRPSVPAPQPGPPRPGRLARASGTLPGSAPPSVAVGRN